MFKLSDDIETKLQLKYPNMRIKEVVNDLFNEIFEKTITDGLCVIRKFGKFISFVVPSSRTGNDVIRFKFTVSTSLLKRIKDDQYLINNLPAKAKSVFNKENEDKCKDKTGQKQENYKTKINAVTQGNKITDEKITKQTLLDILNDE